MIKSIVVLLIIDAWRVWSERWRCGDGVAFPFLFLPYFFRLLLGGKTSVELPKKLSGGVLGLSELRKRDEPWQEELVGGGEWGEG